MNNHHLRSIILKLQYRLSNNDRERLHFFLKNDVPRTIGDDSTLSGTLDLMQSLFDQEKISEQDFTFLIDAFTQIQCFDAVKLLKEHERRMLLSGLNRSTQSLAAIMPSLLDELFEDYEDDKGCTNSFISNQINYSGNNNNNIIDSNNININPININTDTQRFSSSQPQRNQLFYIPSLTNKCFLLLFLLIIFALGTLTVFLIMKTQQTNTLKNELQIKDKIILEAKNQSNQTIKQFNDLSSKKIEELNNQLKELENERSTPLIKAGRKFGGPGGGYFDDSSSLTFTTSHYLSGIIIPADTNDLDSCQFIYTSFHDNQSRIESAIHGNDGREIKSKQQFDLNYDERIYAVQVKANDITFIVNGNSSNMYTTKIITGLKFFTKKGRSIPSNNHLAGGERYTEQFNGYTLGYATGKTGLRIDQLQFFWYRTL